MARVTVEDCIVKIPNRFELVMLASQRARDISAGAPLRVERDNDKNPVVSLREIAEAKITPEEAKEALLRGLQRHAETDEPEDDTIALPEAAEAVDSGELKQTVDDLDSRGSDAGIQVIDSEDDDSNNATEPDVNSVFGPPKD